MFNLLRYFSLTSAAVILVIALVMNAVYRQYAIDELVTMAERHNVTLARSFVNTLWSRYSSFVTSVSRADGDTLRAHPETRNIHEALKTLTTELPVLKVKIYNVDGLTVYSSQPSQMGADKSENRGFLSAALRGTPTSKLSHRDSFSAFSGIVYDRDLVETYIPIRGVEGRVEGVFELYTDVTPLVAQIRTNSTLFFVGLLFLFGLLYAILFLIIRRADLILKKQYVGLRSNEERIKAKNVELGYEVTERRRAEEALRESEVLKTTILDSALDCIVTIDQHGRIIEWNPAAEHIFGHSRGAALGKHMVNLIVPPAMREAHKKGFECYLETGEGPVLGKRIELTAVRADGSEFPVELAITARKLGAMHIITAFLRDITERKQAEEALRASEEQVRLLMNSTAEAIYGIDLEGNCSFANPACVKMLGYGSAEDFLGNHMHGLIHHTRSDGTQYPAEECLIYRAFRKGEGTHVEDEVLWRRDGTSFPAEYWSYPVLRDGEVVGAVVTFLDITKRKQAENALRAAHNTLEQRVRERTSELETEITDRKHAEEALRESEEWFRSVVNNSPTKIHIKDTVGRYLLVNSEAEKLFGVTEEEAMGKTTHEIFPDKQADDFRAHDQAVLETGQTIAEEEMWALDDGVHTYLTVKFPIRDSDGETVAIGAIGTDITERKQAEATISAAMEEAKIANRAKSEFLAAMSHELRTPLNAVIGFSEIITNETFGPVGNLKYRDYAKDINDSGQHLLGIINDILDLSKIESGNDELHEDEIEIPKILRSVLKLVGQRAEQGGIKLELELADWLPALRADDRKLKQILVNLLSNAIKFTDAGGEVTLRAWCRRGSGTVFQIVDTGIGIAPEDIPKALSRFGQIDADLNRQYEGTGLGLPLTKALVEQHGGTLDMQSEAGVGTTVTVRFPAERIVASLDNSDSLEVEDRTAS